MLWVNLFHNCFRAAIKACGSNNKVRHVTWGKWRHIHVGAMTTPFEDNHAMITQLIKELTAITGHSICDIELCLSMALDERIKSLSVQTF